jgi:hypothetical protein
MELSDRTKLIILVVMIGAIVFFFIQSNDSETVSNQGTLKNNITVDNKDNQIDTLLQDIEATDSRDSKDSKSVNNDNKAYSDKYMAKFRTRDSASGNIVNYADGKRGGNIIDADQFFTNGQDQGENYARYVPGKQRKETDADKFNSEALLPQENNKDWMDDPYESTTVKNTHLINIHRPIGVDTIGSSGKIKNRDIRDRPPNPKYQISPFLNSSIEPDAGTNGKALCW